MADSLAVLEIERSEIQMKISRLGDMRAGSITTTGGRCGNAGCHCRKDGDPGHGPFYRLTRKIAARPLPRPSPHRPRYERRRTKWRSFTSSEN
jgi:hypothetical protein